MSASGSPPHLLPGRTAYDWMGIVTQSSIGAFLATLVLGAGLLLLQDPARAIVTAIFAVTAVALGLRMGDAGIKGWRAARREWQAGYTTTYGDHLALWQLDPRTGEVLRRPGERIAARP